MLPEFKVWHVFAVLFTFWMMWIYTEFRESKARVTLKSEIFTLVSQRQLYLDEFNDLKERVDTFRGIVVTQDRRIMQLEKRVYDMEMGRSVDYGD